MLYLALLSCSLRPVKLHAVLLFEQMKKEGRKVHVLQHGGLLRDILEARMLGKTTEGRRRIQLIDDLLEQKNYTDLRKAVERRNI